jgi:hypothetical protein
VRIKKILIENFRAIQKLELSDLSRTIIIAGQNGAGKSCILDAIRLVKSLYGGYQPNEYHMWFGEYNIPANGDPKDFVRLLRNKVQPMHVQIDFQLDPGEKSYLLENIDDLAIQNAWKQIAPSQGRGTAGESLATRQRVNRSQVEARAREDSKALSAALQNESFNAEIWLRPGENFLVEPSLVLEYFFSNFKPEALGVIDFHSSSRNYAREQIGNIDLNIQQREQHFQNHALYNQQNKYQQFKSQLAGQYVRALLAKQAGAVSSGDADLTKTLQELFATFFPGKTFLGPIPTSDGKLAFPVRTLDGKEHDIDDLSSGEKEVLYGYLRLRNATPQNSVVLIDEPELHLNPRLIRGLSDFYHRHLTLPLNCQLWLITHSDTLLRDSVGRPEFSIYYVRAADTLEVGTNQATPAENLRTSLLPLIEDLAGFKPQAKIVLLEGGGETKFDAEVIGELFPLFSQEVNLVSAGSKTRVRSIHSTLEKVNSLSELGAQFYSIADRDSDPTPNQTEERAFLWDVYHIENYLLVPEFLFQAATELRLSRLGLTLESVNAFLIQSAEQTIPSLVRHLVLRESSDLLLSNIEIRVDKSSVEVAKAIATATGSIPEKIQCLVTGSLDQASLQARVQTLEEQFRSDLANGNWRNTYRGRDVLRQFVTLASLSVNYDVFKWAIVTSMKHSRHQPTGMRALLDRIHVVKQAR